MLARIGTDHRHITTLLDLLESKINRLQNGAAVRMPVLHDAVDYLQQYADHCHHPMEDILYQYYLEKTGQAVDDVHQLKREHQALAEATDAILKTLRMILNDQVVPRERLIADLQLFLKMQRDHLSYEDVVLLPKIEATLTEDDWTELQSMVVDTIQQDPLFNSSERDYEDLRAYLQEGAA